MTSPDVDQNNQNRPPLSSAAVDFLGQILTAQYPSQLRGFGPKVARSVLEKQLPTHEIDTVFDAIKTKRETLMVDRFAEPALDAAEASTTHTEQPWSPSDAMPPSRQPDFRELQLPPSDRSDG